MALDHTHKTPTDLGPAFRWSVGLNVGYVIVQAIFGFLTGSLALLADAAHQPIQPLFFYSTACHRRKERSLGNAIQRRVEIG